MLVSELAMCLVLTFSILLTKAFYKHINKIVDYVLFLIPFGALICGGCMSLTSKEFLICAIILFFTAPFVLVKTDVFKQNDK